MEPKRWVRVWWAQVWGRRCDFLHSSLSSFDFLFGFLTETRTKIKPQLFLSCLYIAMKYDYDTHIRELTIHSNPACPHSVVPSIAVPNALSLRWCKSDAMDLTTVVELLTVVKTITLQGTSIRQAVSIPPSVTEIVLLHCSMQEEALASILPTGGSLVIRGTRTEYLEWPSSEAKPHRSPIPVHLEELS